MKLDFQKCLPKLSLYLKLFLSICSTKTSWKRDLKLIKKYYFTPLSDNSLANLSILSTEPEDQLYRVTNWPTSRLKIEALWLSFIDAKDQYNIGQKIGINTNIGKNTNISFLSKHTWMLLKDIRLTPLFNAVIF